MERELVAPGAQSASVDAARGRQLWLPILLVVTGVITAAGTAAHPRAAATLGSAALLSGGAVSALRGRRRTPAGARAEGRSPEAVLVGGARSALTATAADDALRTLLEALAAALEAGTAFQGSGPNGHAPITVPGGAAVADVGGLGGPVPESMRTAEPTVLAGKAAGEAGGLATALAAGAALSVPVRARGGEPAGWLAAARPGERAVPFTAEEIALAEAAAAVAGAVLTEERLKREAQAGAQARSDFLAVMSHELKTPLNVVVGYADLLLMGLPEAVPEGARRNIERLRRSARELQDRIDDILTYVRLADGTELTDEEPVEVDVGAVLREVAGQLEPLARARSLRYAVRTPATRLALRSYPDALARLLRLVLSNAVKFTYGGGIEATAAAAPGGVVVRVADTGVGLAADQLAHIFEPFWQAQRGATRREGGLGLGLTTARALARALSGEIRVESVPGTGTTVTLTLADRP